MGPKIHFLDAPFQTCDAILCEPRKIKTTAEKSPWLLSVVVPAINNALHQLTILIDDRKQAAMLTGSKLSEISSARLVLCCFHSKTNKDTQTSDRWMQIMLLAH